MTIEIINIGNTPNDGTGDPIRVAFNKCNNNFEFLGDKVSNLNPHSEIVETKITHPGASGLIVVSTFNTGEVSMIDYRLYITSGAMEQFTSITVNSSGIVSESTIGDIADFGFIPGVSAFLTLIPTIPLPATISVVSRAHRVLV